MARFAASFPVSLDPVRKLPVRTGVAVFVTVIFFKYLFSCPCVSAEETVLHCWLYLLLPTAILFFVLLVLDVQLLKLTQCWLCVDRRSCSPLLRSRLLCSLLCGHLLRVLYASGLWIVVAFLDGGWYICMRTVPASNTGQQLACKEIPTQQEAEELRKYSSESRIIGLFLILGFFFLLTVSSFIKMWQKPYYKALFELYVKQETAAILEEKLHDQAVEQAKLLSESVLHCVQSQHAINMGAGDGAGVHGQYHPLTESEENMWRTISHPAFHLHEIRTHP